MRNTAATHQSPRVARTSSPLLRIIYPALWLLLFSAITPSNGNAQSASMKESVLLNAVVTSSSITLTAPEFAGTTAYIIYRKLRDETDFPGLPLVTVPITSPTNLDYEDNSISPNVLYEYKVVRTAATTGYGYICTGYEVPASAWAGHADHYMGRVLVLTESNLAASISTELAQLATDLKADGWVPIMDNSVMSTDDPDNVRNLIIAEHTNNPALKAVLLLGRIPVPLAQNNSIDPDGHAEYNRLWPVDGYYGDLDGTWVKHTSAPYAGHFNMHSFPSDIELAVGRVDLSDLPAFEANTAELTAAYLQRLHDFRVADMVPWDRGIIFDNLAWTNYPNASSGWKSLAPIVGNMVSNGSPAYGLPFTGIYEAWVAWGGLYFVDHVDLNGVTESSEWLENEGSYLWTYASGGGEDDGTGADKVGTTDDLAQSGYEFGGSFNMTFGSYIGRWQTTDNYLRAVLGTGHALTSVWAGSPNWYFHNMSMGETVGRSVSQTMNNTSTRYTPQDSWGGSDAPNIHLGLLGDPTLRMRMVAPSPSAYVSYELETGDAVVGWAASPDASVVGYNVYQFDQNGVPSLLNNEPIEANHYATGMAFTVGDEFMVRAVKLEETYSGSYWNLSIGAIAATTDLNMLHAKVKLGGPYDPGSGLMDDALRAVSVFPTVEPYTSIGGGMTPTGGGGGETTTPAVLAVSHGTDAIVDWVLVELRSAATPSVVVEARCGLVQRDGDIVAEDGISAMAFQASGEYYVAVRHRNHLGVMANDATTLSSGVIASVDFTDPNTDTYGTDPQKNVSGTTVLWPGNVILDNTVKYAGANNDRDPILVYLGGNDPNNTVSDVYALEDVNMDNTVKYVSVRPTTSCEV